MTQKQLGDALGMAQTWISKLENPDYGKVTVATLLRLAEAFDTDLEIKFRPFSTTLDELSRQGPEYFSVRSFDEEEAEIAATLERQAAAASYWDAQPRSVYLSGPDEDHISGLRNEYIWPGGSHGYYNPSGLAGYGALNYLMGLGTPFVSEPIPSWESLQAKRVPEVIDISMYQKNPILPNGGADAIRKPA